MTKIKKILSAFVQNRKATVTQDIVEPTSNTELESQRTKRISFSDLDEIKEYVPSEEECEPRVKSFSEYNRNSVNRAIIDQAYSKGIDLSIGDRRTISEYKKSKFLLNECNHNHVDRVVKLSIQEKLRW